MLALFLLRALPTTLAHFGAVVADKLSAARALPLLGRSRARHPTRFPPPVGKAHRGRLLSTRVCRACSVDRQLALFHGLYTLHPGRSALLLRGPLVLLGRDCFGSRERGRGAGLDRAAKQGNSDNSDWTRAPLGVFCGRVRPTDFMLQWLSRPPIRLTPDLLRGEVMQVEFEGWWWVTTNDAAMAQNWARQGSLPS